jgi:membrane protease YdiL (CAAX protease family)
MAPIGPAEIIHRLLLATVAAMALSWFWLVWRLLTGQPILPAQPLVPRRELGLRFGTIVSVLLLYIAVNLFFSFGYGLIAGLGAGKAVDASAVGKNAKAGDRKATSEPGPPGDVPPKVDGDKRDVLKEAGADTRKAPWSHTLLINGLAEIVLLILVPVVVTITSGANLRDLGLSFDDWWRQVVYGVIATLIAAPPVYAIQFGAAKIWVPGELEKHPLSKMIEHEWSVGVGWLAVVTAVVLAPMFEELVFRGLIQTWLTKLFNRSVRLRGMPAPAEADSQAALEPGIEAESWAPGGPDVIALGPQPTVAEPLRIESPGRTGLAIVLTSVLFAYVHAPQWPAPIALFVLALVIGTVYHRTGSLITAVFMHATFNGISTLMMFLMVFTGPKVLPDKVGGEAAIVRPMAVNVGQQWSKVAIRPR